MPPVPPGSYAYDRGRVFTMTSTLQEAVHIGTSCLNARAFLTASSVVTSTAVRNNSTHFCLKPGPQYYSLLKLSPQYYSSFRYVSNPNFKWNGILGKDCAQLIGRCYSEAVHWVSNLFKVPYGKHGKVFVRELSRFFHSYAEDSAMECIALKAAFLLPLLVLQKPHRRSKSRDHVCVLECRMQLWHDGSFEDLLREGKAIQKRFTGGSCIKRKEDLITTFSRYMFEGKVRAAMQILNNQELKVGQPLSISSPLSELDPSQGSVYSALVEKRPAPPLVSPSHSLLTETPPPDCESHSVIFDQIDGVLIHQLILRMDEVAGPGWMCPVGSRFVPFSPRNRMSYVTLLPVLPGNNVQAISILLVFRLRGKSAHCFE